MPRYRVIYHGAKFDVPLSATARGAESIIGFYTTRIVMADSEQEARGKAIAQLLNEEEVKTLMETTKSRTAKTPVIEIESIERLAWHEDRMPKTGFSFYSND